MYREMTMREEYEGQGVVFLDPPELDTAILGTTLVQGNEVLVYSYQGLVEAFMRLDNLDRASAVEWVEYNTLRALPYMGDGAPVVVYLRESDHAL
jgi:hypothetical protein